MVQLFVSLRWLEKNRASPKEYFDNERIIKQKVFFLSFDIKLINENIFNIHNLQLNQKLFWLAEHLRKHLFQVRVKYVFILLKYGVSAF